jgi:hypothetical protein
MTPVHTAVAFDAHTRIISLVTRTFYLWRRSQRLHVDTVLAIDALNRDALTHDEVLVRFYSDEGGLVISEFDEGFREVVSALTPLFPRIERWDDVTPEVPLTTAVLLLWERNEAVITRRGETTK